jgi:hypothetical protein
VLPGSVERRLADLVAGGVEETASYSLFRA